MKNFALRKAKINKTTVLINSCVKLVGSYHSTVLNERVSQQPRCLRELDPILHLEDRRHIDHLVLVRECIRVRTGGLPRPVTLHDILIAAARVRIGGPSLNGILIAAV